LKEADRALKREFGRGDLTQGDSYDSLKERICEQRRSKSGNAPSQHESGKPVPPIAHGSSRQECC
jgi:hypothetical protein